MVDFFQYISFTVLTCRKYYVCLVSMVLKVKTVLCVMISLGLVGSIYFFHFLKWLWRKIVRIFSATIALKLSNL